MDKIVRYQNRVITNIILFFVGFLLIIYGFSNLNSKNMTGLFLIFFGLFCLLYLFVNIKKSLLPFAIRYDNKEIEFCTLFLWKIEKKIIKFDNLKKFSYKKRWFNNTESHQFTFELIDEEHGEENQVTEININLSNIKYAEKEEFLNFINQKINLREKEENWNAGIK